MAKNNGKRQAVYHNNGSDNWVNDTKEQLSLMPGSEGYRARQMQLAENNPMSDNDYNDDTDAPDEFDEKGEESHTPDDFEDAFEKSGKSEQVIKYRDQINKENTLMQTAKQAAMLSGRNVSESEIEDMCKEYPVDSKNIAQALEEHGILAEKQDNISAEKSTVDDSDIRTETQDDDAELSSEPDSEPDMEVRQESHISERELPVISSADNEQQDEDDRYYMPRSMRRYM